MFQVLTGHMWGAAPTLDSAGLEVGVPLPFSRFKTVKQMSEVVGFLHSDRSGHCAVSRLVLWFRAVILITRSGKATRVLRRYQVKRGPFRQTSALALVNFGLEEGCKGLRAERGKQRKGTAPNV